MRLDVVSVPIECRFGLVTVFSGSELRQDKWPYLEGERRAELLSICIARRLREHRGML